jgi:signal recognition particle receptor subunit beta
METVELAKFFFSTESVTVPLIIADWESAADVKTKRKTTTGIDFLMAKKDWFWLLNSVGAVVSF